MKQHLHFHTLDIDRVIDGYVVTANTNYRIALKYFCPLIGRLDLQRDALKTKFYTRLEEDIIRGCVMPPITIALIHPFEQQADNVNESDIYSYIEEHIDNGFVLDGIQRLTTLQRAASQQNFDEDRPIHVNFILALSRDRLLYT
ncbi:hypothetical protein KEF85_13710 [Methylomonas paludis]|uniref:DUF262 domain-containing protein n=1 Tax=Methylomonas paludis TaxID=1173101 RepID=A0A975R8U2_9GAMM|nr:hypothetical protein [Methylomonas paludis]QWF70382.1 hypothetical protein KEF85_13710 [Methylomonas paludis]